MLRWLFEPASSTNGFDGSTAMVVSLCVPRSFETSTWTRSPRTPPRPGVAKKATANTAAATMDPFTAISQSEGSACVNPAADSRFRQQRDRLDVGRVREHVDRPHALERVAPARGQLFHVACERGRVAGDVDDARRLEAPEPPDGLVREPGPRGSTTITSGSPARSWSSATASAVSPAKKAAFEIPFRSAF